MTTIQSLYRTTAESLEFLAEHPELENVLIEGASRVKALFGNAPLHLELRPDHAAQVINLFVYIMTSLSVDEASDLLDELDEQWYLDLSDEITDSLNFNLRFVDKE